MESFIVSFGKEAFFSQYGVIAYAKDEAKVVEWPQSASQNA